MKIEKRLAIWVNGKAFHDYMDACHEVAQEFDTNTRKGRFAYYDACKQINAIAKEIEDEPKGTPAEE